MKCHHLLAVTCAALLATIACGQQVPANRAAVVAGSSHTPQAASSENPTPPAAPAATPPAPTAAPAPPRPALSLSFGAAAVTVSVTGIANGAHQVHVHRDCSGNPNLHITTLGTVFVQADGTGMRTFSLPVSLRGRGFDLLVYPLGASQGPPDLCAAI